MNFSFFKKPTTDSPTTNSPTTDSTTKPTTETEPGFFSKFANSVKTTAINVGSNVATSYRKTNASLGDKSKDEIEQNKKIIMDAASEIYNSGKMPIAGDELYTKQKITVNTTDDVEIFVLTDSGKNKGIKYDEQNYQAIRRALPTMAVKPPVNESEKMAQYEKDVKTLTELMATHNIIRQIGGKRHKTRRNGRKLNHGARKSRK